MNINGINGSYNAASAAYIKNQTAAAAPEEKSAASASTRSRDTVEISQEAIDMTKPRKTSSIFAEKITRMEGESDDDFEKRMIDDLTDKYIEYITKFKNGTLTEEERLPDAIESAVFLPEAVRREGETDEEFALKKLSRDTWNTWTAQWIKVATVAKDMPMGASLRYQNEQHAAWAEDLMNSDPAMFREYLDLMVKAQVDHGNFDVAHVPPGFTINDYHQWMSKDTLEYL